MPVGKLGIFLAIEVKEPGEEPTDIQIARLRRWSNSGAVAFWTDNPDEVMERFWNEIEAKTRDNRITDT